MDGRAYLEEEEAIRMARELVTHAEPVTRAEAVTHAELVTHEDVGDVGVLYRSLAPRLERIVRFDVRASDVVIEDACQFAWARLVRNRKRVRRDTALPWLATTAVREAFKLARRDRRELSLDAALDAVGELGIPSPAPEPEEMIEQVGQLGAIAGLPVRQQRLLWLQGLGLSYTEMASHEKCTVRTVERQLLRAKGTIRAGVSDRPAP